MAGASTAWDVKVDLALFKGYLLGVQVFLDIYCGLLLFVGALVPLSLAKLFVNPEIREFVLAKIAKEDEAEQKAEAK